MSYHVPRISWDLSITSKDKLHFLLLLMFGWIKAELKNYKRCKCTYIYECVQACFIQLAKYSLVYFLSLCSHTPFFFFFYFRALVCFWCMWESAICLLSPLLFCQRLQRLFHKGPSPGLPQTQSSPQQISFTPNPGDTAAISAANSILQQPAVRLS